MNKSKLELKMLVATTMSIVIIAILAVAISKDAQAQTTIDTTAATSIGSTINAAPVVNQDDLREKIRNDLQNTQLNQNVKAQILERSRLASTSPKVGMPLRVEKRVEQKIEKVEDRIENRIENRLERRILSTTTDQMRKDKREGYENNGKAMAVKLLKEKKEVIGKQLGVAMQNLLELRKRISSRIEKDRLANKDLSSVSELLKIADSKIAIAKASIEALRAYSPASTTPATGTTTQIVNLDQVRTLINNAQKSIKDAHQALVDVVVAIAKISGANPERRNATSTPNRNIAPTASPISTTLPTPEITN